MNNGKSKTVPETGQVNDCSFLQRSREQEVVNHFECLGGILEKDGSISGGITGVTTGPQVVGELTKFMNLCPSVDVVKGLYRGLVVMTVMFGSGTWAWNGDQRDEVFEERVWRSTERSVKD